MFLPAPLVHPFPFSKYIFNNRRHRALVGIYIDKSYLHCIIDTYNRGHNFPPTLFISRVSAIFLYVSCRTPSSPRTLFYPSTAGVWRGKTWSRNRSAVFWLPCNVNQDGVDVKITRDVKCRQVRMWRCLWVICIKKYIHTTLFYFYVFGTYTFFFVFRLLLLLLL